MNIELLPIGTHDHPEPHVMRWSELEIAAIRSYAQRCVLHDRNRVGQRLHCLAYDIANESAASDALELEAADELDRLRARVASLEESLHYANGVADLAMKHRDDAENRVAELEQDAEIGRKWRADSSLATWFPFTAEEIERLRGLIAAHVNASNNDDSAGDTFGALAEAVQDAP